VTATTITLKLGEAVENETKDGLTMIGSFLG
jgi:hypothetical protein